MNDFLLTSRQFLNSSIQIPNYRNSESSLWIQLTGERASICVYIHVLTCMHLDFLYSLFMGEGGMELKSPSGTWSLHYEEPGFHGCLVHRIYLFIASFRRPSEFCTDRLSQSVSPWILSEDCSTPAVQAEQGNSKALLLLE